MANDKKTIRVREKNGKPKSPKNYKRLLEYHRKALKTGVGETQTPKGTEKHTMLLSTQTFDTGTKDEQTYIVPMHDPKTKNLKKNYKRMSGAEATKKWMPKIRKGEVTGYASPEEAEKDAEVIRKKILAQPSKYKRGSKPIHKGGRLKWRR